MSTFADFALLATIPSYGGAEILRAQRILPSGAGPRMHMALLGRNAEAAGRAVAVAEAAQRSAHGAVARVLEVGRFDGVFFAVGEPAEGVDIRAILASKRDRLGLPPSLAAAITLAVARIAVELDYHGSSLSELFPAGLSPDALLLCPDGRVRLRTLAVVASDRAQLQGYLAPELAWSAPSRTSEVWTLGALLAALLTGDLRGEDTSSIVDKRLGPIVKAATMKVATRRPSLERFIDQLAAASDPNPRRIVAEALAGDYRRLVLVAVSSFVPAPHVIDQVRQALPRIYDEIEWLYPERATSDVFSSAPPGARGEDDDVFTSSRRAVKPVAQARPIDQTVLIDDIPAVGRHKTAATVLTHYGQAMPSSGGETELMARPSSAVFAAQRSPPLELSEAGRAETESVKVDEPASLSSSEFDALPPVRVEEKRVKAEPEARVAVIEPDAHSAETRIAPRAALVVEAPPGGRVVINGRDVGAGRVKLAHLSPGPVRVKVEHPAYRIWEGTVVLRSDQTVECKPRLVRR